MSLSSFGDGIHGGPPEMLELLLLTALELTPLELTPLELEPLELELLELPLSGSGRLPGMMTTLTWPGALGGALLLDEELLLPTGELLPAVTAGFPWTLLMTTGALELERALDVDGPEELEAAAADEEDGLAELEDGAADEEDGFAELEDGLAELEDGVADEEGELELELELAGARLVSPRQRTRPICARPAAPSPPRTTSTWW